jgi:hypothetical protein
MQFAQPGKKKKGDRFIYCQGIDGALVEKPKTGARHTTLLSRTS